MNASVLNQNKYYYFGYGVVSYFGYAWFAVEKIIKRIISEF